jgi:hypothetical protein
MNKAWTSANNTVFKINNPRLKVVVSYFCNADSRVNVRVKRAVVTLLRGPFENFVDWRQCAAVMPPSAQQRRTAASSWTFQTALVNKLIPWSSLCWKDSTQSAGRTIPRCLCLRATEQPFFNVPFHKQRVHYLLLDGLALTPGVKRPGCETYTHLRIVLGLRIRGAIPPLPEYFFMAWCSFN